MNASALKPLVEAVLYEGYILYPYRASSKKNHQRFTFGRVYPEDYSRAQQGAETFQARTECLLRVAATGAEVRISAGFLHPVQRQVVEFTPPANQWPPADGAPSRLVTKLEIEGAAHQSWQEAEERQVTVTLPIAEGAIRREQFLFPASRQREPLRDRAGRVAGMFVRQQAAIQGELKVEASSVADGVYKVSVSICNHSPALDAELEDAETILPKTFASTHVILEAINGDFVSMTDPPESLKDAASACVNAGLWPVLVGEREQDHADTVLASPIILPDFPRIAPESAGNLYDGTEIDEILTLRIMTMTDEEKREMRGVDEHARRLLERTETLGRDDLLQMHGAMRAPSPFDDSIFGATSTPVTSVNVGGSRLTTGDSVRIRPKARADAMDMMLAGKIAVIEALEEDAEGRVHVAVVVKDDPGRDLGMLRQPGHRFFYGSDEVEPVLEEVS